jgi:hypothetical protein
MRQVLVPCLFPRARGGPDREKIRCSQPVKSTGGIGESRLRGAPRSNPDEVLDERLASCGARLERLFGRGRWLEGPVYPPAGCGRGLDHRIPFRFVVAGISRGRGRSHARLGVASGDGLSAERKRTTRRTRPGSCSRSRTTGRAVRDDPPARLGYIPAGRSGVGAVSGGCRPPGDQDSPVILTISPDWPGLLVLLSP